MRRKSILLLAPILASAFLVSSPAPVAAAGGAIETGTTTYTVNVAASRIDVSIQLRITNNKPPDAYYIYYYNKTEIAVEAEAGSLHVTSNGGSVSQSVAKTDRWYRYVYLNYPRVDYGQTRTISITYSIKAAPRSSGDYRAVKAYVNLCAIANGIDSGSVKVVVPAAYDMTFYSGGELQDTGVSNGLRVFNSGNLSEPYKFWTCLDGTNVKALVSTPVTVAGQRFEIQSWPEDPSWKTMIQGELADDINNLQAMNGLDLPGGLITVREVGNSELGEYAGMYNSATKIAYVTEETGADVVAHELSHIWYNHSLFNDTWVSEGLAVYSEQVAGPGKYTTCTNPGAYPGTGLPDLTRWVILDMESTTVDEQILDYQYSAACYVITELAGDMGKDNFKAVLEAADKGEMAYQGATPDEQSFASSKPLSSKAFLDLIDEDGMVPAGVKDLDQAQTLLGTYGIFSSTELADRSKARAAYHALADKAGDWKLPLAVREPMASWGFLEANQAMDSALKIVEARDQMEQTVPGLSFADTELQKQFQDAKTAKDLADLADTAQQEIDAANVLAQARTAEAGGRNPLQIIGLLGTDLQPGLNNATDALKGVRPDDAKSAAQEVIDTIDGATMAGLLRVLILLGLIVLAFVAFMLFKRFRSRRAAAALAAAQAAGDATGEATAEATAEATKGPPAAPPAQPGA